jgi:hypothetical protein
VDHLVAHANEGATLTVEVVKSGKYRFDTFVIQMPFKSLRSLPCVILSGKFQFAEGTQGNHAFIPVTSMPSHECTAQCPHFL